MPKITCRCNVKGTDIKEMMAMAREKMADLGDIPWEITDIELWEHEDMATKEGMMKMFSASMTMEAEVKE